MNRIKYGVSPWIDDVSRKQRPDYPRAHGTIATPVAIVGGGLTGCLTAYAFAAAGIKVTLLEADRLGQHGSGHGPGILSSEPATSYREIEARHGRKAARAMFEASRRAVLDLAATVRRLELKIGIETCDAIRVLGSLTADERSLRRDADLRREAGLDAVSIKAAAAARESKVDGVRGAVRLHDWGLVNPFRLCLGVARAASQRGAAIFERSTVRRVKVRRKDVELHLDGAMVSAESVVVCTGEPSDLYRPLKRHAQVTDRYAVLTDRLPAAVRKQITTSAIITDTETPPHVIRWVDETHLLVAGGDQPRQPTRVRDKVLIQRTGQLMYELSRLYPAISGVMPTHGWDVPLGVTADGVMYAGPHRNYPHHLFAWGTRHDPGQAFLASRILLRHYLGQTSREDAYFGFTRG